MSTTNWRPTYPPQQWDEDWNRCLVSEQLATDVAKRWLAKRKGTFDAFHSHMVAAFGMCEHIAALYLWHKLRPGKPPKFIYTPTK